MGTILIILINLYVIYLGFCGGSAVGTGWTEDKYDDWKDQKISEYTHQVTIYWDEDMTRVSTIYVREDMNWTIAGSYGYEDTLYGTSTPTTSEETELAYMLNGKTPEGKTIQDFAGLWTSAYGGTQYLNSAGYSLYTIKEDITLFAVWA